jgi:poly[(R)-3-hydroxyalkanoate] polymerase subunit PhaC
VAAPTAQDGMAAALRRAIEASPAEKAPRWVHAILTSAEAPVGQTPKEVVWTKNKARLYRYVGERPPRYKTPVLLVFALINRPYVFDLRPGHSFVEFLLKQGFEVYLLDWGVPGEEDRHITIDDYVCEYMRRAVRKVCRTSGVDSLTMLGYCIGGTLTACYVSLFAEGIRNVVLLTAPIDFAEAGRFGLWTDRRYYDVDKLVDTLGNVPGRFIDFGAKMLNPVVNTTGTYVRLWDRVLDEAYVEGWKAMNRWVGDNPPFAGAAFRQWIKAFYQENRLTTGRLELCGRRVDLANITQPLLDVAADRDAIAPMTTTQPLADLISSTDKEFIVIPGGHVGIMAGRGAQKVLWPRVAEWLSQRSS